MGGHVDVDAGRSPGAEPPCFVVGLGASAGGLEALQKFFAGISPGSGAAFVVVQHLAPGHDSSLREILSRTTPLLVVAGADDAAIEPDRVYVAPAGKDLVLRDGRLVVTGIAERRGGTIDPFFRSLAEERGARAVGIVLSGHGTDGTAGLGAVKERGGLTLAQAPESAEASSMPESAVAAGVVAEALPVEAMPARLLAHFGLPPSPDASAERRAPALAGHIEELVFRPEVQAFLVQEVLPLFTERASTEAPLRLWLAGCASAEAAYMLAVLALEHIVRRCLVRAVKVFASHPDASRITLCRKSLLPASFAARLSPERLERFFVRDGDGFRPRKTLRDACLFVPHDLLEDPPFGKIDLIASDELARHRNNALREQVLVTFHYALSSGGYLLTGAGDPGAEHLGLFQAVSARYGVFRRCDTPIRPRHAVGLHRVPCWAQPAAAPGAAPSPAITPAFERALWKSLVPPTLVVDESGQIVYLAGDTSRFVELPPGAPRTGILELVRRDLRAVVLTALAAARQERREATGAAEVAAPGSERREVRVTARPLSNPDASAPLFAVTLHERALPASDVAADDAAATRDRELELESTRRHLQGTIDDLSLANQDLRLANAEQIVVNEDLENENLDLQQHREELQSTAEELQSLLAEHVDKIDQLDAANADLRNVAESSPVAIVFLDHALRITRFTPPAGALFHLIPADLGRPAGDIAALSADGDLRDVVAAVLRSGSSDHREVRRAEGGRWFVRSVAPYRQVDGEVSGVVVAYLEFTEQKRAEDALRASEARYRTLADMVPSIVWTSDPAGRLTYVNDRWCAYTGIPAEQAAGTGLAEVIHPDDRPRLAAAWESAREARAPLEVEVRRRRADGEYRWFLIRAQPTLDAGGRVAGWFGVSTDVHERKLAEDVLREADRHKDEFLALLAHELRNPLAPIRNVTYLLQRPSDATLARVRGIIERQVGHMARLVDDLLDVSRITQGKLLLTRRGLDLVEIVRATAEDQRPAIEARTLSLEIDLPRAPLPMTGDPTRLTQVVGNLLHNAAKFTDPGGAVRVVLSRAPSRSGAAQLVVEDTGAGIAPEVLPRVFDAFVQAEPGRGGGLGLGLSLVKGIVALHGGSVRAESAGPGRGARFTVELPVDAAVAIEGPVSAPRVPLRVLVVEDQEDSAESMRLLLELLGHQVAVERSGDAALATAKEMRPEIVFCDIMLGGQMDGYDVARALRADPALAAAHLVAMTGLGSEGDRKLAAAAGFEVHLTKPVRPDSIESVVNTLVAG